LISNQPISGNLPQGVEAPAKPPANFDTINLVLAEAQHMVLIITPGHKFSIDIMHI